MVCNIYIAYWDSTLAHGFTICHRSINNLDNTNKPKSKLHAQNVLCNTSISDLHKLNTIKVLPPSCRQPKTLISTCVHLRKLTNTNKRKLGTQHSRQTRRKKDKLIPLLQGPQSKSLVGRTPTIGVQEKEGADELPDFRTARHILASVSRVGRAHVA
ncbi:hypothetical protein AAMO2058_001122400 [Amorphochlora amoebiformis]